MGWIGLGWVGFGSSFCKNHWVGLGWVEFTEPPKILLFVVKYYCKNEVTFKGQVSPKIDFSGFKSTQLVMFKTRFIELYEIC